MPEALGKLTYSTLKRRAGRTDKFLEKLREGEDFVFTDGTASKLDGVIVGTGTGTTYTKDDTETLKVIFDNNDKLTLKLKVGASTKAFGTLAKTAEFGGQSSSSSSAAVGGKVTEVLSEIGFCFYYALQENGHLDDYNLEVWSTVNNVATFKSLCSTYSGVPKMLKFQYKDVKDINARIGTMYSFLKDHGWDEVLRTQVSAFKRKYPSVNSSYYLARPSAIPDAFNPYSTYRLISGTVKDYAGLSRAIGEDKWNPADFWIFNDKGIRFMRQWNDKSKRLRGLRTENYSVSYMNLVNKQLISLYKQGLVYPVSLKRTSGTPNIKEINSGRDEISQIVEYDRVELSNTNLDVQIYFTVKTYEERSLISTKNLKAKMKTKAGGFRLELEEASGGSARHGSIGMGLQEFIIKDTSDRGINRLEDIRGDAKYNNIRNEFPTRGARHWLGTTDYISSRNIETLIPYLSELMSEVNSTGADIGAFTNKYSGSEQIGTKIGAAELAVSIAKIVNRYSRDIVMENLYNAAGSQGIAAGVSQSQLDRRRQLLGMSEDDVITIVNDTKALNAVFQAGFHLKIM